MTDIRKLSESEAVIVHTVRPQMASLERIWPTDFNAFDPERFEKQVKLAFTKVPELVRCSPPSIIESLVQCAELGLDPSGTLGGAYLIPYGERCTLVIGYRGLRDLAHRSGAVKSCNAYIVHAKDAFDYDAGKRPKHKPYIPRPGDDQDTGPAYAVWAFAVLPGGGEQETVMSEKEIQSIKARVRSKKSPWFSQHQTDVEEMWKKTALRRNLKYVPLSPSRAAQSLARAIEIDDEDVAVEEKEVNPAPGNGASRTAEKLGVKPQEQE